MRDVCYSDHYMSNHMQVMHLSYVFNLQMSFEKVSFIIKFARFYPKKSVKIFFFTYKQNN